VKLSGQGCASTTRSGLYDAGETNVSVPAANPVPQLSNRNCHDKNITTCPVLYVCNVIRHIRCEILGQYIFFITLFSNTPNSMSFSGL